MAERSASRAAPASAVWLLETGRRFYRLTYRADTKNKTRAEASPRLQLASLQCWGEWATSFA
ncbi:MAG: hypothetical protein WAV54_03980 [Acidimicrobiales bacterium]